MTQSQPLCATVTLIAPKMVFVVHPVKDGVAVIASKELASAVAVKLALVQVVVPASVAKTQFEVLCPVIWVWAASEWKEQSLEPPPASPLQIPIGPPLGHSPRTVIPLASVPLVPAPVL